MRIDSDLCFPSGTTLILMIPLKDIKFFVLSELSSGVESETVSPLLFSSGMVRCRGAYPNAFLPMDFLHRSMKDLQVAASL